MTRRVIEAVITSCTRNAVVLYRARGFESHTLRQKSTSTSGFAACGLFSFSRFLEEYFLCSLLKWASSLLKIVRFHAKNGFIRTLPYVLAYLLNMIRLFLKRLLPMPRLTLLPLHPQRTAWNYSPDVHIHWRLWRSRCDRAILVSVSSVRRLRAAAKRSCV